MLFSRLESVAQGFLREAIFFCSNTKIFCEHAVRVTFHTSLPDQSMNVSPQMDTLHSLLDDDQHS